MKKTFRILIAGLILAIAISLAGCSLFGSNADSLANGGSVGGSSGTKTTTTYTNVSKAELESALTQYREIAETLSARVDALEDAVRDAVGQSKANIGAYAVTYVDSVMNLSCVEKEYNLGCQGTGFIISEDGYVITNNHVVSYEETVVDYSTVQRGIFGYTYGTKTIRGEYSSITGVFDPASKYYNGGNSYELQFVYRDADYDLALCKLVPNPPVGENWTAIPFYSGAVTRGDELLLLGNARGFGLSATSGLVSATGKTFTDSPKLTFIQTDAAINGGNSGGPAINIYGGLIGVVNSKFVSSEIENMGFAIELSKVKTFLTDAQTKKSVTVHYKSVGETANA